MSQRLEELEACWSSIQDKASQRRARLGQAEDVQKYLSHWTELMYVLIISRAAVHTNRTTDER